jgi:peptidoglycan/LPS O-acetylase OafA/YrhL
MTAPADGHPARTAGLAYMPHLDSLRALAAGLVLMEHFWAPEIVKRYIPTGFLGVRLFFVLSGFLITAILLNARNDLEPGYGSFSAVARHFYTRRALRLFPVFYLTVLIAAICNVPAIRSSLLWHLFYSSNFYFAWIGHWVGAINHFWSLAVEEQFYLLWPWVILLCPRAALLRITWALPAIALVFQGFAHFAGLSDIQREVLPPGCVDALGAGALLAVTKGNTKRRYVRFCRNVGIPAFFLIMISWRFGQIRLLDLDIAYPLLIALGSAWIVHRASCGFSGLLGRFFSLRPLIYLGKISYGIYIYHNFCPSIIAFLTRRLALHVNLYVARVAPYFVTVLIASFSWYFLEGPIQRLKAALYGDKGRAALRIVGRPVRALTSLDFSALLRAVHIKRDRSI